MSAHEELVAVRANPVDREHEGRRESLPGLGLALFVEHDHRYVYRASRALIELAQDGTFLDEDDELAVLIRRSPNERRALAIDRAETRVLDSKQVVRDAAH